MSPLTSSGVAVPLFFLTIFLTVCGLVSLLAYAGWSRLSVEGLDVGRRMSIALREGLFAASVIVLLFVFQILGILTWWIGILVCLVFVLVEIALHS